MCARVAARSRPLGVKPHSIAHRRVEHAYAETHATHARARSSTALLFSQPWRQAEPSKTSPPLNVLVTNAIRRAVASAAVQQTPEAHAATVALAADGLGALIALATEGTKGQIRGPGGEGEG